MTEIRKSDESAQTFSPEHTPDIYPSEVPGSDPYSDMQTRAEHLDNAPQNNLHIFHAKDGSLLPKVL
jgi:hypothetical protein